MGHKARVEQIWDSTLYHLHDLPFAEDLNDMGDVFTPVKNKVSSIIALLLDHNLSSMLVSC